MSLPGVTIIYDNGALGQTTPLADGCLGFIAIGAEEVSGDNMFKLGKDYTVKQLAGLESLGVTAENNPNLYRNTKDFFEEAGDGAELWLMGFPATSTFEAVLDKDNANGAKALLLASNGKIRMLMAFKTPDEEYEPEIADALDSDVWKGLVKAQGLGEWATNQRYAPIFTLIEGYAYDESEALKDLRTMTNNRVGIVLGDTTASSPNACMGVIAGRLAAIPVQRKISRVKDGAIKPLSVYIGSKRAEGADAETLYEKGYITFRKFVGKDGYFVTDDPLATAVSDDYSSITNRCVIDKAYRIAYNTLIEEVNDDIPVSNGQLVPGWCTSMEQAVESAIVTNMTNEGNLGNDPEDPRDTAVECSIPYEQDIYATSKVSMTLRVKPKGYMKFIEVPLGFTVA